ncbi:MAG: hypothetical protein L0Z52_01760 [Acidobacteria bacterium]|nr:hypothetical protein [Acidobacteriota bacterium]
MKHVLMGAAVALLLSVGMAHASVGFDVAVGMNLNEDTRIFLNVTNQTWQPAVPTTLIQGCAYPEDDFPVIAFLSYHSHRSPSFILNLRREGYGWADIFFQLNVQPSVLFVGINRDPGPPYGKAWGYWKKHHRPGTRQRYRIADRDIVGLVKVQTASRHFGASPFAVIDAQRSGRRPEAFAVDRWKQKNGRKTWTTPASQVKGRGQGSDRGQADAKSHGQTNSKGKGNGKGQGKGHGADRD